MSDATRDRKGDIGRDKTVSRDTPNVALGVTITAAAKTLGVSVRTVQRRLDSGVLRSTEQSGRRLVVLESNATPNTTEGDILTRQNATNDATRDTTGVALLIEQRERDRAEIAFLRNTIEALQRDSIETRAALREALKAPKQLTSGAASEPVGQVGTDSQTPASAPEAPTASAISPDEVSPVETPNGAELGEIDDLIYKVFGR